MVKMKQCNICSSDVGSLRISPQHGNRKHAQHERACEECWEAWLSLQVEENKPEEIVCMFCTSPLDFEQIASLARKGTAERYTEKLKDSTSGIVCMRRCTRKKEPFDREKDGRVFICEGCEHQMCVDCSSPEHSNETCSAYLDRLSAVHAAEEQASHKALKAFRTCPSCGTPFTPQGCGYTQCKCAYRFCSGCMIPWVGEGSAYLSGKAAHGQACSYLTRDRPSEHGLKRRFQEEDEVQARIEQKYLNNKRKREAKKARVSMMAVEVDNKSEDEGGIKTEAETRIKNQDPRPNFRTCLIR